MSFEEELKEKRASAEQAIRSLAVLEESGYGRLLAEAMNYSLLSGGKRLRPVFMLAVFESFGGREDRRPVLDRFMAAIELIHTYSLVHDDLPAMDNDVLRRGRETTHVKYGEDIAILAGDALLNRAFETAAGALLLCPDEASLRASAGALSVLAEKAGSYGMIGGQVCDVMSEKGRFELSEESILYIFRKKTAALIEASMMIGAIIAGAADEDIKRVEEIAANVGIAFQIRDDILDASDNKADKAASYEEEEVSYVTLKGLSRAERDEKEYSRKAMELIDSLFGRGFLYDLVSSLIGRSI
ncbi:MAG TPA: farnesyl-diphosphate synthase [Lachnospiraceae bacterium]|nr:farnesyl-diphosphate synthase [Lachnospiraceae bacterium]